MEDNLSIMSRPPRLESPGALYHLTSRGNARKVIFHDRTDRERFLEQLAYCLEAHSVILYAYVLMDNHYHLLAQTRKANLSAFCQRLNTSYALYARHRQRTPGHILQGRYKAKLIESEAHLGQVATYIHLNPVRTRSARDWAPERRERFLLDYPWSSLPGYLAAGREQAFVNYDALGAFGSNRGAARQACRRFLLAALHGDGGEMEAAMRTSEFAIGSPTFIEEVERRMRDQGESEAARRDLALPPARPRRLSVDEVKRAVARRFDLEKDALDGHGRARGVGAAKQTALELAARHCGLSLREVGGEFGGLTPSAVTMSLRRGQEKRLEDFSLRAVFEELDSQLTAVGRKG